MKTLLTCVVLTPISPLSLGATLRVPLDHPTVQQAIEAASPGDTILVAAGEYEVTEPISFKGKDLVLRSESGALLTSIRMLAQEPTSARRSVVIFESGETLAATLEGFTLMGGHGSHISPDETVYGGGILCINDSAASIIACHIQGNVAESHNNTVGGGVAAIYGSSVVLREWGI